MPGTDHHVVIVGGGFAGLWATRALARAPVCVTLIDRANHHLFQPLLYQVATAGLSSPDIAAPLRHILRNQANVEVRMAVVERVEAAQRRIVLEDGSMIGYDTLLLATGATHTYFGHDEWAAHAPGLKTLDDALHLRRRLLLAFERAEAESDPVHRAAWLSFAIVGGGPTGVELAGTLAEIAHHTLRREFRHIDPASAKVRLIEGGPRVLSSFPESLSEKARAQLQRLGVEVVTGTPVDAINDEGIRLGGTFVPARTVVWAAGVAASPLAPIARRRTRSRRPRSGVAGPDRAGTSGNLRRRRPGDGSAERQTGAGCRTGGETDGPLCRRGDLCSSCASKPVPTFRYRDYGNLATIGRMAAVVDLRGLRFSGLLAWWFWLAAHVFFLIGFRNRLVVLLNWFMAYWSYQRAARIIVGHDSARGSSDADAG